MYGRTVFLNIDTWKGPYGETDRLEAIEALESGAVLYFSAPAFALRTESSSSDACAFERAGKKHQSRSIGKLKHDSAAGDERALLQA